MMGMLMMGFGGLLLVMTCQCRRDVTSIVTSAVSRHFLGDWK